MSDLNHHRTRAMAIIAHVMDLEPLDVLKLPAAKIEAVLAGTEHLDEKQIATLKGRLGAYADGLRVDIFSNDWQSALDWSIRDEKRVEEERTATQRAKKIHQAVKQQRNG